MLLIIEVPRVRIGAKESSSIAAAVHVVAAAETLSNVGAENDLCNVRLSPNPSPNGPKTYVFGIWSLHVSSPKYAVG